MTEVAFFYLYQRATIYLNGTKRTIVIMLRAEQFSTKQKQLLSCTVPLHCKKKYFTLKKIFLTIYT